MDFKTILNGKWEEEEEEEEEEVALLHDCSDAHSIRQGGGQIFERVDDQVDLPQLQRYFQLAGEESLLSDLRQSTVQNLITDCRHGHLENRNSKIFKLAQTSSPEPSWLWLNKSETKSIQIQSRFWPNPN